MDLTPQSPSNPTKILSWILKKKLHILIWIIFIFYEVIIVGLISGRFGRIPSYILYYILNISLFYFHAHVVLYTSLKDRKSFWKLPVLLIAELICYFMISICLDYIIINYVGYDGPKFKIISFNHLAAPLYRSIYFIIFSSGYYFLMNFMKERRRTAELESLRLNNEIQIAKSENAFLKAQIQPHLLFNTLDFIYQTARDTSPVAAETILSLSEMMRYSVDSNHDQDFISIGEEINQVENLINLHQLRKNHQLQIRLYYENEVRELKIIPLVLITLVENMFKHGDLAQPNQAAEINISYHQQTLTIETTNLKKEVKVENSLKSGIDNIRKRLNFAYKNDFELLFTTDKDNYFKTTLIIKNP